MLPLSHSDGLYQAVDYLNDGGIVAFPTDTLYALGADALSPEAVRRVFQVKKRPSSMGLPIFLADISRLDEVAADISKEAWRLAMRFWPGPLTLVLKKMKQIPDVLTGGSTSVAVRVPNHPVALALLRELGGPVTGTSANLSSGPELTTAQEVREALGSTCQMILEGPPAPSGVPSTIVDLSGPQVKLVRAGAITLESLEEVSSVGLE